MQHKAPQQGLVLLTSLIFILAITIIGFAGLEISGMQQKMAGNMRNKQMAFQGAEAALNHAETFLRDTSPLPKFDNSNGYYQKTTDGIQRWVNLDWLDPTEAVILNSGFQELSEQPAYMIETFELENTNDSLGLGNAVEEYQYYRITARARGASPTALVIIQSIYSR